MTPARQHSVDEPPGDRSSTGRSYSGYRHSTQDLQRVLRAVNAVSWLLADAQGDARSLVDSTLPVIAQLLGARAVVLVSAHPGFGGTRVCLGATHPGDPDPLDEQLSDELVRRAEQIAVDCPPTGTLRQLPDLACVLLLAPLPRSGRRDGYVAAAVPQTERPDGNDLAILGTLTNQLAGAIESSRRLACSEASRDAADAALLAAAEQARALARRNELLKQARHELVGAREKQVLAEERQRIARDLHDSVAQHVLSMGMQVEWCRTTSDQPVVVERLSEVKSLARSTIDRIRSVIFELNSGDDLQTHGLWAAVELLAEEHRTYGLTVEVRLPGPRLLPAPVERALYMVVKEALFNTVTHADAGTAVVDLATGRGGVRLSVSDDGCGRADHLQRCLDDARRGCADGYHRGLVNMEARVRQLGGRLALVDQPGGGVGLDVWIPVRQA